MPERKNCQFYDKTFRCLICEIEHCPYDYEDEKEPEDNSDQKQPLVIFRCNCIMNDKQSDHLRNYLIGQIEDGVVLLPHFISVEAILPADCEIRFVDKNGNVVEGGKVK